jgi:periplasmic protein TonB
LASAADISSKGGTPSANSPQPPAGSPVAHEAPVTATGARPGENSGKRELFSEATTTALVFRNGGVIRLSVAVEPGQLLFLTNQQNKREVVTQVTRRRDNPATGYYVELEFTEPAPDFWGIELPESPAAAPAPANSQQRAASELLRASESNSEVSAPRAAAPSANEIQGLMNEVEALRAQLKSLQTQAAPADADAPRTNPAISPAFSPSVPSSQNLNPAETPKLTASPPPPAPLPPISDLLTSLLAAAPAAPPAAAPHETSTSPAHAATPAVPAEERPVAEEKVIPENPEEDSALEPAVAGRPAKPSKNIPPVNIPKEASSDRLGALRLALLAAVSLFAVSVAAWNMHWFPWSSAPTSTSFSGRVSSAVRAAAHLPPRAGTDSKQNPGAQPNSSATPDASGSSPSQVDSAPATVRPDNSSAESGPSHASSQGKENPHSAVEAASNAPPRNDSESLTPVAKHSTVPGASATDAISTPLPGDNSANAPPRLLKSVRAVAPSDALRDYVTGNVTLDALIDESGHVKSMKVLSGPAMLHKAAMEALREYRYEPARHNGKRVSAHLTVTIPFWFEP